MKYQKGQPVEKVEEIAVKHGYWRCDYQPNIYLVSYAKEGIKINVYLTKMTVGTCLDHPKKGKTQLFRKKVSLDELEMIFKNPRIHTGKGYYQKRVKG
jgi:hypothetical protein